jgi:signal transduction histidine kinase
LWQAHDIIKEKIPLLLTQPELAFPYTLPISISINPAQKEVIMKQFFSSLTFKIGIIIILIEIIVLMVIGYFYINWFNQQIDQRLQARVELPGKLVAKGLLGFGSIADEEIMTDLVGENLIEGMVVGADKTIFYSLNPDYAQHQITDVPDISLKWFDPNLQESFSAKTPDGWINVTPIRAFAREKSTFFVYIKAGTGQSEQQKETIAGLFILGSTFGVVITSIAIIYLFNSMILSRIRETLKVLGQVETGNLTARIDGSILADEIGILQQGVNSMTARLEETVGKLERRVADLKQAKEALKTYADELERSNRELESYANVAAHDLQEPLRKVQAFGDRIKIRYGQALDERGRDYLERMQSAAARMQALIQDLLTFSRITTQASPFVLINLNDVIRGVLADLETRIEAAAGQVEVGNLPTIEADPVQMRQLLQNLIANALKFHRDGTPPFVKIEGDVLPAENNSVNGQKDRLELCRICVTDNGVGFDEKYLDRIFAVFQRLHGRNEYEGTGVGLAICRKIVERHNGKITARSKPGAGATFIITLPTKQPEGDHTHIHPG